MAHGVGTRAISDRRSFRSLCRLTGARLAAPLGAAVLLLGSAAGSHATIMLNATIPFLDLPERFDAKFVWDFPAAGDDSAGPFTGNCGGGTKCWTVNKLESLGKVNPDGKRNLIVFPQHTPGQRFADPGHGPNAMNGFLGFFDVQRPPDGKPVYASANRLAHGAHADYFTGVVKVPRTGDLQITIAGMHEAALKLMEASFTNFTDKALTGYYQPSYGVRKETGFPIVGDPIPFGTVDPGKSAKRETLPKKDGKDPTDYVVVASGSATTETTLAYLGTIEDDPAITELELAALTEMLAGPDGFVVPMLRELNAAVDLFVFVNLLQWLAAEATFSPLQTYDIEGGANDLLPGFFVSTTPVSMNLDGSFNGTPFSGLAFAAAAIDGHIVPAPPTLALVAAAVLGLVVATAVRRERQGHQRSRRWARIGRTASRRP